MTAQPTPGPWQISRHGDVIARDALIVVAGDGILGSGQEQAANARLIASAPELLEALEGLLALIKLAPDDAFVAGGDATAQARAAIEKARQTKET